MRVRALLKRYRIASSQTVQAGDLSMNRKTYEVTVGQKALRYRSKNSSCSISCELPRQNLLA